MHVTRRSSPARPRVLLAALADRARRRAPATGRGGAGPNRDALSRETGLAAGVAGRRVRRWPGRQPAWAPASRAWRSWAAASTRWATGTARSTLIALSAADGKRRSGRRGSGPAWDDEYGGPRGTPTVDGELRLRDRHRGRPGVRRGGHRQGALAQEPAARLRRPHDVDVEVQRVAAGGRRPPDRHARRARRGARGARQGDRQGDLAHRRARPRARGQRRRRLLVDRGLERRRREAVRAAPRPRPRGRARERRQVPLGLQPRGQRRRQHLDADRARELVFASTGYQTGAALARAGRSRRRASQAQEVYFLGAEDVPEPPRRHGARRATTSTAATATARASPSASSSRPARWPGAATSATRAPARRPWSTPTATSTSATRTASWC